MSQNLVAQPERELYDLLHTVLAEVRFARNSQNRGRQKMHAQAALDALNAATEWVLGAEGGALRNLLDRLIVGPPDADPDDDYRSARERASDLSLVRDIARAAIKTSGNEATE